MPSFETHMQGHAANLRKAISGDAWRDHFRAQFAGAFKNLGVPAEQAGPALTKMMDIIDKAMPPRVADSKVQAATDAVMKIFAETCQAASKVAA